MKKLSSYLIAFGGILALVMAQAPPSNARRFSDWSAPVYLGPVINSASNDQQPAIAKNGLSMYFSSNRPGGLFSSDRPGGSGGPDLYMSTRAKHRGGNDGDRDDDDHDDDDDDN